MAHAETIRAAKGHAGSRFSCAFGQKGGTMSSASDLRLDLGAFADTTATVEPVTDKGKDFFLRHFGTAVTSVKIPKSQGIALLGKATAEGLLVG